MKNRSFDKRRVSVHNASGIAFTCYHRGRRVPQRNRHDITVLPTTQVDALRALNRRKSTLSHDRKGVAATGLTDAGAAS